MRCKKIIDEITCNNNIQITNTYLKGICDMSFCICSSICLFPQFPYVFHTIVNITEYKTPLCVQ